MGTASEPVISTIRIFNLFNINMYFEISNPARTIGYNVTNIASGTSDTWDVSDRIMNFGFSFIIGSVSYKFSTISYTGLVNSEDYDLVVFSTTQTGAIEINSFIALPNVQKSKYNDLVSNPVKSRLFLAIFKKFGETNLTERAFSDYFISDLSSRDNNITINIKALLELTKI
jgi:hypothetical protein